jgi:hypothetical protein
LGSERGKNGRASREKQVPRFARNDRQKNKGKGNSNGNGNSNSNGNGNSNSNDKYSGPSLRSRMTRF